jgi:hypothetical protein
MFTNSCFRRSATVLVGVALVALCSCASGGGGGSVMAIGESLVKSYGLTGDQSAGAVGSILSLAQGKLGASDYSKVASAVPGADGYVQKAKDLGAVPSTGISDKSGLDAAYSKLGISPEVGSKVTGAVVDYAGKAGGSTVSSLLGAVLK